MTVKTGDIVTLVVDGQELDAEVVKTYEDIGQDYVDLQTLSGGAHGGIAYQTVTPAPKEGESIRHFVPKTAAEQKAVKAEREEETPPPGGMPAGTITPDADKDLAPGAKKK